MEITESGLKALHNHDLTLGRKLLMISRMLEIEKRLPRKRKKYIKKFLKEGIALRRTYKSLLLGYRYGMSIQNLEKQLLK